jgi:DinB superfamily
MFDRHWIDLYAAEADAPLKAIQGLTPADLNAFPIPGTWSIQQIVIHLMESDLIATDRMKRVAAEATPPLIVAYDESAFIKLLAPERIEATKACELFKMNRELTAIVLRSLPDSAFEKFGIHNQRGKMMLGDLVKGYVEHARGHLVHLHKKRAMLGK